MIIIDKKEGKCFRCGKEEKYFFLDYCESCAKDIIKIIKIKNQSLKEEQKQQM